LHIIRILDARNSAVVADAKNKVAPLRIEKGDNLFFEVIREFQFVFKAIGFGSHF